MATEIELEVPLYFSDEESESDARLQRKKQRESKNWRFVSKFPCARSAEAAVNAQNTWAIRTTHTTTDGKKRFYRCKKVPKDGIQCAAEISLLYEADSESVLLYCTDAEHDHQLITDKEYGICNVTKAEIDRMLDLHLKPKSIMAYLEKQPGIKTPSKRQLYNYLAIRKRKKYIMGHPQLKEENY